MTRILIATDGSPAAWEAVVFGVDLASTEGAEVVFVHVEHPVSAPAVPTVPSERGHDDGSPLGDALAYAAARAVHAGAALLAGDTVDEIVACADSLDADLIVVGSREQGTLPGTRHGSTSRGVLHEARRPVLVVLGSAEAAAESRPLLGAQSDSRSPWESA